MFFCNLLITVILVKYVLILMLLFLIIKLFSVTFGLFYLRDLTGSGAI